MIVGWENKHESGNREVKSWSKRESKSKNVPNKSGSHYELKYAAVERELIIF